MMELPIEIAQAPAYVQAHYISMIEDGQQPRFAEMCALSQPPGTGQTDRAFLEGRNNMEWLNKIPKRQADRMVAAAKAAGVNPAGKYYFGGIADKRGIYDPKAWVSDSSDVKKVAEERGMDVDGAIKHKSKNRPVATQKVALAQDIVDRETKYEQSRDPNISKKEAHRRAVKNSTPYWHQKKKK